MCGGSNDLLDADDCAVLRRLDDDGINLVVGNFAIGNLAKAADLLNQFREGFAELDNRREEE